jgi:predicted transglutaminase-like cysteine proteinase
MSNRFMSILLAGAVVGSSSAADAFPLGFSRHLGEAATYIRLGEGGPVLAPFEHVRFCLKNPSECATNAAGSDAIELNDATARALARVNARVNASIAPERKAVAYSATSGWSIAPASGDCNDYAVTKRHRLMQMGMPAGALLLAVVRTESGEGHLVLVVRTDKGDLVLDNLYGTIRPWFETDYEWVSRQSSENPRRWVQALRDESPDRLVKPLPFFASGRAQVEFPMS